MEAVTGEGGQNEKGEDHMNVIQMIHGAYNIQNWQEIDELNDICNYVQHDNVANQKFKLVGACVSSFKGHIET